MVIPLLVFAEPKYFVGILGVDSPPIIAPCSVSAYTQAVRYRVDAVVPPVPGMTIGAPWGHDGSAETLMGP